MAFLLELWGVWRCRKKQPFSLPKMILSSTQSPRLILLAHERSAGHDSGCVVCSKE